MPMGEREGCMQENHECSRDQRGINPAFTPRSLVRQIRSQKSTPSVRAAVQQH
jgi:hypothetical protein